MRSAAATQHQQLLPLLLFAIAAAAAAAPDGDRVIILPGLRQQPSFRHFSGYLRAGGDRQLHYWLVESSAADPAKAPLVLWFNGGPGCSSMEGLLREHGPFRVNDQASLDPNPYAWNQKANVLYIEAPAGVGFSYSASGATRTNDTLVAEDNYLALKDFLRKFPEFVGRELHISGESYGGVYVPTLAARVLRDSSLKLRGVLIGNGIDSWSLNSLTLLYFGYYHGLLGEDQWQRLTAACCDKSLPAGQRCDFYAGAKRPGCQRLLDESEQLMTSGLDIYNVYKPCHRSSDAGLLFQMAAVGASHYSSLSERLRRRQPTSRQLARRFLFHGAHSRGGSRLLVGEDPPCTNSTALSTYLDLAPVRYALHVKDGLPPFTVCANIDYTMVYKDMSDVYRQLMGAGIRITAYNGDVDMACNFLQTEWFLQRLNMTAAGPRKQWQYQHPTEGAQVGGYVQQWHQGVTYLTVRGSGHMVPEDKPAQALQLFNDYLANRKY